MGEVVNMISVQSRFPEWIYWYLKPHAEFDYMGVFHADLIILTIHFD